MRRGPDAASPYRYVGATARSAADGWESLGDIGKVDADGYVYITDRLADMILVGGANVYPAEIEAALDEHPAVRSCSCSACPTRTWATSRTPSSSCPGRPPIRTCWLTCASGGAVQAAPRDRARDHAAARRRREGAPLSAAGRAVAR